MVKRRQRSSEPAHRAGKQVLPEPAAVASTPETSAKRKPYRRPTVEKRRSLAEATLFSGSGMSGTLIS
jgi:hypothetical protein